MSTDKYFKKNWKQLKQYDSMVLKPPHRQKLFVQAVITMATLRHQATFSQIEYFTTNH